MQAQKLAKEIEALVLSIRGCSTVPREKGFSMKNSNGKFGTVDVDNKIYIALDFLPRSYALETLVDRLSLPQERNTAESQVLVFFLGVDLILSESHCLRKT